MKSPVDFENVLLELERAGLLKREGNRVVLPLAGTTQVPECARKGAA